ncbi:autotransporter strand-loop-strand O-heptosyltransferase [Bombella intestini]|uniref:autotransporter strand-loop-strand O-heptosyltransferase n=1 Tax=Bombella intestini TaxID=1539051 RepID=UPI00098420F6|nr:autotransporter strand-loop-strand O-heptosyltransferase [Bombella intestini]
MTEKKTERVLQDIVALKPPSSASILPFTEETVDSGAEGQEDRMVFSAAELPSASLGASGKEPLNKKKDDGIERLPNFPFPAPEVEPTQEGPYGLRYDFNLGIRVKMPEGKQWRVRFWDMETDTCLYDGKSGGEYVTSRKKYFLQVLIELFDGNELVWTHEYDARRKKVAIIMPTGTLGDPLGWVPYIDRFGQKHDCDMTVVTSEVIVDLMGPAYPHIRFLKEAEFVGVRSEFYASYYIGLFFHDEEQAWQPRDFRAVGLHRTAGWIMGVDPTEIRPRVAIEKADTRPIEEPYVVVAVQASCACKMWQNPLGWLDTVQYLKKMGYRVICIDKEPVVGHNITWNHMPNGVEDETGERPLAERARWIKHADFFVGLSSGLSWLAWAVGTPVVMISGFTDPINEFQTPYRVFSNHGCNSCWHDLRTPFQHNDYLFCPRHKGTERAFECTRNISTSYVLSVIKKLCRDHDLVPPAVAAGEPWPDDVERVKEVAEVAGRQGYEHRHEIYWKL